jgi:hypothetical protein
MVIIDYPWTKTKEDVAAFYNVEETKGLSEERVKRDLERYGPNGKISKERICIECILMLSILCRITSRRGQTTLETYLRTIR